MSIGTSGIIEGQPVGWVNPVTFRAVGVLPPVGAWDPLPIEILTAGAEYITLYVMYTRAAAGGAVDIMGWGSPYNVNQAAPTENWFPTTQRADPVIAAGVDSIGRMQRELYTYQAVAAGVETFTYGPVLLGGTVERLRFACRESGAVGNPGTCHIVGVLT